MALVDIVKQVDQTLRTMEPDLAVFGYGEEALAREGKAPMVTWLPTADAFELGGEKHVSPAANSKIPRTIAMRLAGCDAYVWSVGEPGTPDHYGACEQLLHQTIAALRAWLHARDLIIVGGRPADRTRGEVTAYGRAYILSFQVRIPVTQQGIKQGPVTTATSVSTSTEIDFPDGQQVKNS